MVLLCHGVQLTPDQIDLARRVSPTGVVHVATLPVRPGKDPDKQDRRIPVIRIAGAAINRQARQDLARRFAAAGLQVAVRSC